MGAGDTECRQVPLPVLVVGERLGGRLGQRVDQGLRQTVILPIRDGRIGDAIAEHPAQQQHPEKIEPALALRGLEEGKVLVADMRRVAIAALMAGAGIVDRQRRGAGKAGGQDLLLLGVERRLALGQEIAQRGQRHLDAEGMQLGEQLRLGHIALVVLLQHEANQVRSEMADNAGRQRRRHQRAVGRAIARAMIARNVRLQPQVLHDEAFAPLEPAAFRQRPGLEHLLLMDGEVRGPHAALPAPVARSPGTPRAPLVGRRAFVIGTVLHPARLERWPRRQPLEPRDLVTQPPDLLKQIHHQRLDVIRLHAVEVRSGGRPRHTATESQP